MRTSALIVGLVCVTVGVVKADENAEKKALKELEGEYVLIGMESKNLKLSEDDLKKGKAEDSKFVIKGDQMIAYNKGKDDPATIKLDPTTTPRQLNLTSKGKDGKTEYGYGIYKFEDGVLTICAVMDGEAKDRPKEFKVGEKVMIMRFRKSK